MTPQIPAAGGRFGGLRAIFALVLREMDTTYGRSPGGYLWAVVEPVAAIALLSFAFSLAFRAPALGASFPLFYATGYMPYMVFHDLSNKTASAIRFSRPLLSFGAVTYLDAIFARFALNLLTHLLVFALVTGGIHAVSDTRSIPDLPHILNSLGIAAVLALGVGTVNCHLFLAFPAWERLWSVLTRPLFVISGVFFLYEHLPLQIRPWLWLNPLFHVTGEMRRGFYPTYHPDYVSPAYAYGVGTGLLLLGLMILSRSHDDLIHK